jgi:hypothetical protein
MAENTTAAMHAWQEAEEQARAAENLLLAVWQEWTARRGPAVSRQLLDEVTQLRDRANDKLTVILSLLRH